MADTGSGNPPGYFIVHGFGGGELLSKGLIKGLKAAGFNKSDSAEDAEIVIAHSAGYWLLDDSLKAKIIILVGPALPQHDTRKTYRQANALMWKTAVRDKYVLKRLKWAIGSVVYLIKQPKHNRNLARLVSHPNENFRPPKAPQVILIANREDPWPRSELLNKFLEEEPWAFISLPGSHEHIKDDPAAYVAIIEYYAKRLLA